MFDVCCIISCSLIGMSRLCFVVYCVLFAICCVLCVDCVLVVVY